MEVPQPLIDAFWATVQALLVTVIPIVVLWLGGKVIEVGQDVWRAFKSDNSVAAYEIEAAVEIGMKAAEQNALLGEIEKLGKAKKDFAVSFAQKWLHAQGVKIDAKLLADLVESRVQELFPKKPVA